VRSSTDAIRAGQFDKVVLARRLQAELAQAVAIPAAMERLRQMYPTCYVVCMPWDKGQVLAATPELLACKRDDELISHALAGTIRREEDVALEALGQAAFFASAKEREEHDLVVASIKRHMQTLCARVEHAAVPALMPLRFVQHLWTRIHGQLCTNIDLLDAVLALHPTPAVLGMPAAAARDWLAHCGEQRDGLYTGVVGWLDTQGDGDAVVVLRAAYLAERKAVLWAGAGIMADSDPVAELAETELRLQTMLEVLGSHR